VLKSAWPTLAFPLNSSFPKRAQAASEAGGWREGRGFIGLGRTGSAIAARVLSGDLM
jgi:hypothetical protein